MYAQDTDDVAEYVRCFGSATGEPAQVVITSRCSHCASTTFSMECSEEDGVAMRTCTGCRLQAHIGDSADLWDRADTGPATCPCGASTFELAVGFCVADPADDASEVDWIVVGAWCTTCRLVGVYADWGIDHVPSAHLRQQT